MKRLLVTLTLLFSLVSMSSFASEEKVTSAVLRSFNSSFKNVAEVEWTARKNFYKASFNFNGQYVNAFYKTSGEMIALTKNISSTQLPLGLQTSLKNEIKDLWITELFEVANEEGTTYYVTLENADTKLVLKSSSNSWSTYQKQSKS